MANGLTAGPSEAEIFQTDFLQSLKARGLGGLKLMISFAGQTVPRTVCRPSSPHTGLKAAIRRVFVGNLAAVPRSWMRNALADVPKGQHTVVAPATRQAFNQPDQKGAVAGQPRPRWPKLATLMDESEADVLAYMALSAQHRTKLHSMDPLERLNKEVKR